DAARRDARRPVASPVAQAWGRWRPTVPRQNLEGPTLEMLDPDGPTFEMLDACVAFEDSESWGRLLAAMRPILARRYREGGSPGGNFEAFCDDFAGWMFLWRKHIVAWMA